MILALFFDTAGAMTLHPVLGSISLPVQTINNAGATLHMCLKIRRLQCLHRSVRRANRRSQRRYRSCNPHHHLSVSKLCTTADLRLHRSVLAITEARAAPSTSVMATAECTMMKSDLSVVATGPNGRKDRQRSGDPQVSDLQLLEDGGIGREMMSMSGIEKQIGRGSGIGIGSGRWSARGRGRDRSSSSSSSRHHHYLVARGMRRSRSRVGWGDGRIRLPQCGGRLHNLAWRCGGYEYRGKVTRHGRLVLMCS